MRNSITISQDLNKFFIGNPDLSNSWYDHITLYVSGLIIEPYSISDDDFLCMARVRKELDLSIKIVADDNYVEHFTGYPSDIATLKIIINANDDN